ncbi:hypothetical protein B0H14DRAFT_3510132 [Mycena olivaceomarginata]|nr:hypothetical protein B0H14DRAFT_3510132 [Mycena olivaceomarginata]
MCYFSTPLLPAQPGIVSPPPPGAPVHGSSAPAMDGFGGVPPPSRRTMAAQRTSSAARTLIRGPFAVGNHTGLRGQCPNATSFNTQDLMVVLWPMVLNGDYDPPGYPTSKIAIKNQHLKRYTDKLASFHLVFKIQVPAQGPMLPAEFSRQVQAELNAHGISFHPPCRPRSRSSWRPLLQLWVLLQASIRQGVYTLKTHPTINDNMFGLPEFKKINTKFPNPMAPTGGGGVIPWIPIAPQFGHLISPVDSFSTPVAPLHGSHPCMGWRILDSLPRAQASAQDDPLDVECYDGYCPSEAIDGMLHDLMNQRPSTAAPTSRPSTPPPRPQQQSLIRQRSLNLRFWIQAGAYDVEMTCINLPPQSRSMFAFPSPTIIRA